MISSLKLINFLSLEARNHIILNIFLKLYVYGVCLSVYEL